MVEVGGRQTAAAAASSGCMPPPSRVESEFADNFDTFALILIFVRAFLPFCASADISDAGYIYFAP
jgi:hypothetical protein